MASSEGLLSDDLSSKGKQFVMNMSEYAQMETTKLRAWVREGPMTVRLLCMVAGIATAVEGLSGVFDLLDWPLLMVDVYLTVFGLMAVALEGSNIFVKQASMPFLYKLSQKYSILIEQWAKLLAYVWGRGLLYIFVGSILFNRWTFDACAVGLYDMACGGLCLLISHTTGNKLKSVRLKMGEINSMEDIKKQFDLFDKDHSGFLETAEVAALASSLGSELNHSELEAAINLLDKNRDGKVDLEEFTIWWTVKNELGTPALITV